MAAVATPQLTSTTAPGKVFASRQKLADHYKSDWHKYNLKRREAGLPLLLESDFQARLAAALSLRKEDVRDGTNHLKRGKKQRKNRKHCGASAEKGEETTTTEEEHPPEVAKEQVDIDPKQCLFDRHYSSTVSANADRMYRKYGFFIPDSEYLTDLEGLIGYCHEKIKLGHMCLYCHKVFPTWHGCQKHMISKRHAKLCYEAGIDLEDLSVFYDFTEADGEFLQSIGTNLAEKTDDDTQEDEVMEDDGDEDWEDISDDEDGASDADAGEEMEEDDQYGEQLAQFGFDVTELGELVLPNGRVIGHRALSRYYRQRVPSRDTNNSTAVVAARRAAGERLFNGQVINIHGMEENSQTLAKAGIKPGAAAGRAGKGILVKGEGGAYTSLSIYRYRAVMRKQRREDKQGKRLYEKSKQNINRMDKKHNRLMNGVSVAHAAR